jgi:hypothetical protein
MRGRRLYGEIDRSLEGDVEGDDRLYDGGDRSRLESSSPSLSSSASHLRFLVCFAGGEEGGGVMAGTGALAVPTWAGCGGGRRAPLTATAAFTVVRCNC